MAPQLAALARNQGDKVVVLKVNVEEEQQLAMRAGVRSIPDMRLLHAGRELERMVGYRPAAQLEHMVVKHAARLPAPREAPPAAGEAPATIERMNKDWLPPGVTPVK